MEEKKLTVFFYPAWYPHRYDPMFGLFVKRHAEAVSQFAEVCVIFVIGEYIEAPKRYDLEFANEAGVKTVRIYFKKSKRLGVSYFINGIRYLQAAKKGYDFLVTRMGEPNINHVHVLTRAGLFPLWKKITSGIPYLITEHWSRYLPINKGAYSGIIRKFLTEKIVERAFAVTPVSQRLAEAMQQHGLKNSYYRLINNVVDVDRFLPVQKGQICARWVHVSCFDEHPKNITGLLSGFAKAHTQNPSLRLTLIGDGIDWKVSKTFAENLNLGNDAITFTGLLEGKDLSDELQRHDAFVMFSRFENQPVVIIEAFACGLPVVATDVGSIPEMLANHRGIVVQSENADALADAFIVMSEGKFEFSRTSIRQYAVENYSFSAVGKKINELYLAAIENDRP